MWKLLAVPLAVAALAVGAAQAVAKPAGYAGKQQDLASGVTLAGKKHRGVWKWPRHNGGNDNHHHHHHHNNNYYYPYYYPYYRPYYQPYWSLDYCGWGYGYGRYDCLGSGYYGGYYGRWYYDRDDYPRRERVSNKKHVKWCRARYKTYDAKSDSFIGKGRKKYRCNSPYDGRR